MGKVKVTDKYTDVTFCANYKCRKKTCYRHICHCGYLDYHSEAFFDGTRYCLKLQEEQNKNKKKIEALDEEEGQSLHNQFK